LRHHADPVHLTHLLRLRDEQRGEEGEDEEGDGRPEHGHLPMPGCYAGGGAGSTGGLLCGLLYDLVRPRQHRRWDREAQPSSYPPSKAEEALHIHH
jgi:hypothetical protein